MDVGTFVVTFFSCFLNLYTSIFLLRQALPGLNFVGIWPPIRSQSDKFCKSGNSVPVQARASKSSFMVYVFQLGLPFSPTYLGSRFAARIGFTFVSH